jgi:hypothetical protein
MIARTAQNVFVSALVAVIAAGCGGGGNSNQAAPASTASTQSSSGGSSSASAWAASFCGYAQTWKTSLQKAGATLKTSNSSTTTAAALNSAKSANILFQQQLSRMGPPEGASQQVTQQLRSYGGRLKSTNQSLQGLLSEPTNSASESAAKAKEAKSMVQVMASQLRQAYAYLTQVNVDPQMKQALTSNSTCQAVFGKA